MKLEQQYFSFQTAHHWIVIGLFWILSYSAHSTATIPTACEGVKEGLIACYPFDGNTNDLSGKNYHGVPKNITYAEGQAGQAARFDGKTSYVEIANNPDLNSPQISFSAWVKPTINVNKQGNSVGHGMIFNKELQYELAIFDDDNPPRQIKGGEFSFAFGNNWDWMPAPGAFVLPNKFVHVVLTFTKERTAKLYVEGKLVREQQYANPLGANALCMRIGARNCPSPNPSLSFRDMFEGDIDEFRIYNRELSETEVKQLAGVAEPQPQEVAKNAIPSSCQGVKEGLIACYPFDGNTNDLSGKNYHGVPKNITYAEGKAGGQSAHFDGKSSYVEIANNPDLNSPQVSLAAWVKPLDPNAGMGESRMIFHKDLQYSLATFNQAYERPGESKIGKNELSFAVTGYWSWIPSNYTATSDKFIHVVFVFTKEKMAKLYVDGQLVASKQYSPTAVLDTSRNSCMLIGARYCSNTGDFFNGDIDEFRVYNRELSETEVKQLAGVAEPQPQEVAKNAIPSSCQGVKEGLIACYPFDGNTNDLSGKNYHGNVVGNLTYVAGQAGQAAHFDGSNYVEIAETPEINSPQISFAAWVKPLSLERPLTDVSGFLNKHTIFNKEPQYSLGIFGESYMKDRVKTGELSFAFNPNWLYMPTGYMPQLNQFIHVVLTFDQNNVGRLYVDGKLIKEEQYTRSLKAPAEIESVIHIPVGNLRIGASTCLKILSRTCQSSAHSFFNGDIDEFRIYNRSLSETEVKQLAGLEPIKPVEPPVVKYTVSVTKAGEGKGEVQAEDLGLKCGSLCQYDYPNGSKVTLKAFPLQKNYLKEWTGDCSGTNQNVTITVDKAKNCTAIFMPEQEPTPPPPVSFNVVVTKTGTGDVKTSDNSIDCGATCQHSYTANSSVNLTATPAAGHLFKEWSGDCTGNNPVVALTVDKAKNCTATFVQQQQVAPTPTMPSQLCFGLTGMYGQDRAAYCNDYAFEGNHVPCIIHKNGEISAGECAQDQLAPKPLANKILPYAKQAVVGKNFSAATPRCDSSVEFSAENKIKAPSNMAFICVRYEKTAGSNSFYYGLAFVNDAQILSYKFETAPDRCVGNCPK